MNEVACYQSKLKKRVMEYIEQCKVRYEDDPAGVRGEMNGYETVLALLGQSNDPADVSLEKLFVDSEGSAEALYSAIILTHERGVVIHID